jgi:asparagine synthase (glutamine-hydrolysing)
MCGIAGIISAKPLSASHYEQVSRMSDAMVHRGPDGSGFVQDSHLAMAMRRLSIIDVKHGWQPLYNEKKSLALIANGEIYNSRELRQELEARGHVFRTHSDCEVIVHLYEELGTACVHRLRGMFAFALWDEPARRLVLARDRMGEKPLYLYEQRGMLVFGSELKTLLHSGLVPFVLDPHAVDLFFHYQYVPEPATPLSGVRKLPPATILTVEVDPWRVTEQTYWRMEDAPALEGNPVELIRAQLEEVSELTIRSDVPVGIALSGGLDSSAIAALAVRKYPGMLQAFSVGYEGRPRTDERQAARTFAEFLKVPFHEIELSTRDVVDGFADLSYWRDDPIADTSGQGYFAVMRAARAAGVPVMLMGQGADELFWGYGWVREAARQSIRKASINRDIGPRLADYLRVTAPPLSTRRPLLEWFRSAGGLLSSLAARERDRTSPADQLVFYDVAPEFQLARRYRNDLYAPAFRARISDSVPYNLFTVPSPWPDIENEITRLICRTYLLQNGIAQGDRLSMASSVELRLPLVDYRLVETVIGLRKVSGDLANPPKSWFRGALHGLVPEWVLARPKQGFQPPWRAWVRGLFEAHGHLLSDGVLVEAGVISPEAARRYGKVSLVVDNRAVFAFRALVLEMWCRQCLSRCAPLSGRAGLFMRS